MNALVLRSEGAGIEAVPGVAAAAAAEAAAVDAVGGRKDEDSSSWPFRLDEASSSWKQHPTSPRGSWILSLLVV